MFGVGALEPGHGMSFVVEQRVLVRETSRVGLRRLFLERDYPPQKAVIAEAPVSLIERGGGGVVAQLQRLRARLECLSKQFLLLVYISHGRVKAGVFRIH